VATNKTTVSIDGIGTGKREAIALDASDHTRLKALPGARYLLAGSAEVGPENATLSRSGSDLQLTLEGQNSPALVLEGYFSLPQPAGLYGLAEDGRLYAYGPTDGSAIATLANGHSAPVALVGSAVPPASAPTAVAMTEPPAPEPPAQHEPASASQVAAAHDAASSDHATAAREPAQHFETAAAPAPAPAPPPAAEPAPMAVHGDGSTFWPLLIGGGLAAIGIGAVSSDKGTWQPGAYTPAPETPNVAVAAEAMVLEPSEEIDLSALPSPPAAEAADSVTAALAEAPPGAGETAADATASASALPDMAATTAMGSLSGMSAASTEWLLEEQLPIAIL
jgi:hypothetical protein